MGPLPLNLLPEDILYSHWFAVLTGFVAINTVLYVTLAALKSVPVIRPGRWFQRRYVRSRTRSIHPDAVEAGERPALSPGEGGDPANGT